MPDKIRKATPDVAPSLPSDLAERVRRAVTEPKARAGLRVSLHVQGGRHDERYDFRCALSATGEVECALTCAMSGRHQPPQIGQLSAAGVASVLRKIDVERLVAASHARPRIPPDSLIGRLEVTDGVQEIAVVFMADPEQAEWAGYTIPPAVSDVVEAIHSLAAKQLRVPDVGPSLKHN